MEHLRALVTIADAHRFDSDVLSDLTATYRWLSSNVTKCRSYLLASQHENLFLNVEDPKAGVWTFVPARSLLFDGHDEGGWKRARNFLSQFRELLLEIGAKQITAARRPNLQPSLRDQFIASFRASLNDQRKEEQFTDVALVSSDGREFPAHKVILSASTKYFSNQFGGGWRESSSPSVNVAMSGDSLRVLLGSWSMFFFSYSPLLMSWIDYIYSGNLEQSDQDRLLELLEVSHLMELWDLFARVEYDLIDTITLGTVNLGMSPNRSSFGRW